MGSHGKAKMRPSTHCVGKEHGHGLRVLSGRRRLSHRGALPAVHCERCFMRWVGYTPLFSHSHSIVVVRICAWTARPRAAGSSERGPHICQLREMEPVSRILHTRKGTILHPRKTNQRSTHKTRLSASPFVLTAAA
jgi:hypothetical protein